MRRCFLHLVSTTGQGLPADDAPGRDDLPGILLVGVFGSAAPYFIIRAMRHAEASLVSPLGFFPVTVDSRVRFSLFRRADRNLDLDRIMSAANFMLRGETRG